MADARAAYPADRAAALAGVPKSTLHYWARNRILVPSVSAERVKLWSFEDVVGLRIIDWLRQSKTAPEGTEIPGTTMRTIREALNQIHELNVDLWSENRGSTILADRSGHLYVREGSSVAAVDGGQVVSPEVLDLLAPFSHWEGYVGPDLRRPRPLLRILPGKLGGAPHVEHTRVETAAIGALAARGLDIDRIAGLYPALSRQAVEESIDLEKQLATNLAAA